MDYCNTIDYWEEEGHVIDSINGCSLLWTIIPLFEQVGQYKVCSYTCKYTYTAM